MGLYLYCVVPADTAAPTERGIDGAEVHAVREDAVCAWVGDVSAPPKATLSAIREHDRVIRSAMDAGVTPVPIRFGQVVPDEAALRAHLAGRDYTGELERVEDAVEFGLRIIDPEAMAAGASTPQTHPARSDRADTEEDGGDAAAAGAGAAYLRTIADRLHEAEARRARSLDAAHALDSALDGWVRDRRIEASERPAGAVVAHLVQTSAADAYLSHARALSPSRPPLRIVVTGPWPPYSFVGS